MSGRTDTAEGLGAAAPAVSFGLRAPNATSPWTVLLTGATSRSSWTHYVRGLIERGNFAEQSEALARLQALTPLSVVDGRAAPTVGIVVSDPAKLLPGHDANLDRLMATLFGLGCRPVLIGPQLTLALPAAARPSAVAALAASLDGVVGMGGADVAPELYGETATHAQGCNLERDRFEVELARACFGAPLFMLGICRSHQLWNVAAGGALIQDLAAAGYTRVSRRQRELGIDLTDALAFTGRRRFENRVQLATDAETGGELGRSALTVNAAHHQALRRTGRGFRVTAMNLPGEGERAFIAGTERWNGVTVQFHPETRAQGAPERSLMELLARRAHVAYTHRMARAAGVSRQDFLSELRGAPVPFRARDLAWAERLAA